MWHTMINCNTIKTFIVFQCIHCIQCVNVQNCKYSNRLQYIDGDSTAKSTGFFPDTLFSMRSTLQSESWSDLSIFSAIYIVREYSNVPFLYPIIRPTLHANPLGKLHYISLRNPETSL